MNDVSHKVRRRWLQFRLRTLCILVLLCAVCFGWLSGKYKQVERRRQSIEWVQKLQGRLVAGEAADFKKQQQAMLDFWFPASVDEVYLQDKQVSDPSPLAEFNDLRTLSLYKNPIHDLSALTNSKLEELFIGETQVTDVTPLVRLTNLQWLFLNDTPVTDVSPLAELTNLRGLDLTGTRLSEADVRKMQQELPNCYIIGP